jgi:Subtilase family/Peptidase inhibitor I9
MAKNLFFLIFLLGLFFASCNSSAESSENAKTKSPQSTEGTIIKDQYIIELNDDVLQSASTRLDKSKSYSREEKGAIMEKLNAEISEQLDAWLLTNDITPQEVLQKYTAAFVGAAIKISPEKYDKIRRSGDIKNIEHDRIETLPPFEINSIDRPDEASSRAQTTPCGITNAGGSAAGNTSRWIWIVDTGIDLDHPDLQVVTNTTYARTFVAGTTSADDCNGHGTHVAGIAAALNNTIGVVGVAAGANVVPVRVFGCGNSGNTSEILAGINHVATYDVAGDVCNMSLGGFYGANCSTGSNYLSAVNAVANGGTRCAIASGNSNSAASSFQPGCINGTNIFTVTNMRCNKTYYNDVTYGGNYGVPPVDWIATGTSVYSTYLNGGYATLTGTSMSSPHVAGILNLRNAAPAQNGTVLFNGVNYKIAVK